MATLAFTLFAAGMLTILLPCILPLVPIVVGVSIADRHPLRPLMIALGMVMSFVLSTFLLQVLLSNFVETADYIRIGSLYLLFLFGLGFLFRSSWILLPGAALGGLFLYEKGWIAVIVAAIIGVISMEIGGRVATKLQTVGSDVQAAAANAFGRTSLLSAFVIGATLGLVWAPCAGPALSLALTLVRDEPGAKAFVLLLCYALGSAVPLLIVAYGGRSVAQSFQSLASWSGTIKHVAGVILILLSFGLYFGTLQTFQIFIIEKTGFGDLGSKIENTLFAGDQSDAGDVDSDTGLPVLGRAPEFEGLSRWHNSDALTMASLRGKVVLIDFWTYSCINCIRTLPYIRTYWEKFKDQPFVLVGIHTPEFTFEKSESNVAAALKRHGLTYPVAQDNDFGTWNAFRNRYWPAKYLIDAEGRIRYTHFGEGAYEETDAAIASLLAEIGAEAQDMPMPQEEERAYRDVTRETYLHSRSWEAFQNAQGDPDAIIHAYDASAQPSLHSFVLGGSWQLVDDERQVLRSSDGEIRITALAGEVNLVLGLEEGAGSVAAEVIVDGKAHKTFIIDGHDLYPLYTGDYGTHDIRLVLKGKGVEAYAYTFGG